MNARRGDNPYGFVSLAEAAKRSGLSVRTLQRWIADGILESVQHPADRRRRLVSAAALDHVGQQVPAPAEASKKTVQRLDADRRAVIVAVMGLYQQTAMAAAELDISLENLPEEAWDETPFAKLLWILIDAVRGDSSEPPPVIHDALQRVVVTLFADPITKHPVVPDQFWYESRIGRDVARAQLLLYPGSTLVTLNEIVARTGMARRRVDNILRDLGVRRVYDPDEERWLYPTDAIEAVQSWTPKRSMAPPSSFAVAEDRQVALPAIARPLSIYSPGENRTQIKAVRSEYHRRHYPDS